MFTPRGQCSVDQTLATLNLRRTQTHSTRIAGIVATKKNRATSLLVLFLCLALAVKCTAWFDTYFFQVVVNLSMFNISPLLNPQKGTFKHRQLIGLTQVQKSD